LAELGNIPQWEDTPTLACVSHPQTNPVTAYFYVGCMIPVSSSFKNLHRCKRTFMAVKTY